MTLPTPDPMVEGIAQLLRDDAAKAAAAREAFEASPEGETAKLQSELRVLACSFTPQEWERMHRERGVPTPDRPRYADLSISEQRQVMERQLAAGN